jgi:hypothetical protein
VQPRAVEREGDQLRQLDEIPLIALAVVARGP